jgi:CIC family chloride channel protein
MERAALPPHQFEYVELILLAALIGVFAALANLGFRQLIGAFSWLFQTLEGDLLGVHHGAGRILLPIVLMSGGGMLLLLNRFFPGEVLGYGFPSFLETVNLGKGRLRKRWIFLKGLGAAVSLGCGAAVGREGPIAQIGGSIGSALAALRRLPTERAKILIAAGAGAGIATTFNAPMGGMMFAQEIVLQGANELGNLTLILVATFTAVVTSRALTGDAVVFPPGRFMIENYWEMVTYGAMGLLLGALAAGYIRFFHATARSIRSLKVRQSTRLIGGLALVGLIAIPFPQNLADGYPLIVQALHGDVRLRLTIALMGAKFIASAISLGAGAPGGVFGPVFFIGAMAGASFRGIARIVAPGLTGPAGSYALVGLGAFLSAVTHAPLTALLMLFEMTRGDWTVVLPAMITTLGALVVARMIEPESIDSYSLAREGKSLAIGHDRLILTQLPVASAIDREVRTVPADASLTAVMQAAGETTQSTLPVIGQEGELVGLIVTRDLLGLLAEGAELGALVNAWDVSRQHPPVLTLEANLDQAAQLMEYEALEELPVAQTATGDRFIGLVTRTNIAHAFNRVTLSPAALATGENNIFWASGYRVSRMQIPSGAVGKTLRDLDVRTRFEISVLAVQANGADGGFAPVAADRPFQADDLIIAAGGSADLRRFARELDR